MCKPSILLLEFYSNNLEIIELVYKKWDYEKCLKLSKILINELEQYSDVEVLLNKAINYKQLSSLEIFFKETTI